jgi:hypothetical protein
MHACTFVQYPNVGGFFFSCIQMGLYLWYRKPSTNVVDETLPTNTHGSAPGPQVELIELPAEAFKVSAQADGTPRSRRSSRLSPRWTTGPLCNHN